jgi:hypothetical protein
MDHDVVRARRFELVDDEGRTRAVLTAEADTHLVGIHIANAAGRPAASMGLDPDQDFPIITLRDPGGDQARLSLTILPSGEPLILMRDNEGHERNIEV